MLSTGDIRDWDAVVDQVLRCLVLKAPVDRRRQTLYVWCYLKCNCRSNYYHFPLVDCLIRSVDIRD